MPQLYVSESTIAKMLGHDAAWLRKNSAVLERQYGFPTIDPAIGKRHAPSVERWASERNAVNSPARASKTKHMENLDAL